MKDEVLRMDRVVCMEQGERTLNHFSLSLFAGEIVGLIPINGMGMQALLQLLRQNVPIHYGFVHYRQQLVNRWQHSDGSYNRIGIISSRSGLADDLTVADNVFVLRSGFGKWVIRKSVLRSQLRPFLREIGVDVSADACVRDLSAFERFVVEIVKAVVAGSRLIVLMDAETIISEAQLHQLHEILRYYAREKGICFLYVSQHYEELRSLCDRVALMMNGQIVKVLNTRDTAPAMIHSYGVDAFEKMVRGQRPRETKPDPVPPVLTMADVWKGNIHGLSLHIAPGECVVLQDLDNRILEDFVEVMACESMPEAGRVQVGGRVLGKRQCREVAVIQRLGPQSMLFPDMSYLDNLCFTMDHRLRQTWQRPKVKASIRQEYMSWLGADVFDKRIDQLTSMERYDLIYARILLQRPKVAFCVQPFMQADVEQRMHIWKLLEMLLDKRIAVVILAVNLADVLSLADRLIRVRDGRVSEAYQRERFGTLPQDVPWYHLWDSGDALDRAR